LGGGQIFFPWGKINLFRFVISDLKTLLNVKDHFINYPLQSTKLIYFAPPFRGGIKLKFYKYKIYFHSRCQVLDMMVAKEHLTIGGLNLIVAIRSLCPGV
jgi:hypothetical protein